MRTSGYSSAAMLALVLSVCIGSWAEQAPGSSQTGPADSSEMPRLTLGGGSGTPGSTLVVPLYLATVENIAIGELKSEIRFVSRSLKFSRLERGSAAAGANVELRHEIEERKDERGLEQTTLRIIASSAASGAPGSESAGQPRGVPAGLIGYITLRVDEGAGPANITLHGTAEATELATKKPVANVDVVSEQVEIIAAGSEPLVSCFFFTH